MGKRDRTAVKKPNGVLYFIVYILFYPILKILFRLVVDRRGYCPPKKGAYVIVSNHVSFMDFLLAMLTVYPHRVNAVAALKFFLYWPLNLLLPFMGCIPKRLFDADTRAIMGIMAVIRRGDRILLFPEARCTVDGEFMGIHKSTGKLIKKLGVPVISCRIEGSYNCMPFWRKGVHTGRVRVTLANLFSADDTQQLTPDEISTMISERLSGADAQPSAPTMATTEDAASTQTSAQAASPTGSTLSKHNKPLVVFRGTRLTEGLENIIYYCPECGGEFTIETKGNMICCTACGNAATMDCAAKLTPVPGSAAPESVHAWYRAQAVYETGFLYEGMAPYRIRVTVRMPIKPGKGIEECGRGELWLDSAGWHYDGDLRGESAGLFFPIDTVPAMPFDPNDNFQIYANGSFYSFTPENVRACSKYATIGECAYWRFASPIQMTPGYDSGFGVFPPSPSPSQPNPPSPSI